MNLIGQNLHEVNIVCYGWLLLLQLNDLLFVSFVSKLSNTALFPCLHSLVKTRGVLGEFETVVQTRDVFVVGGLHNFREFSRSPSVKMRLCEHGKSALLLNFEIIVKSTRKSETSHSHRNTAVDQ